MMVLEQLLKQLKDNNITVEAFGTSNKNGISYEYVNLTSDKIKRQDRFTLNVIGTNYAETILRSEQVKKVLLTLGDEGLQNTILSVELNGGGTLYNKEANTYHIKQIYTIKSKERC